MQHLSAGHLGFENIEKASVGLLGNPAFPREAREVEHAVEPLAPSRLVNGNHGGQALRVAHVHGVVGDIALAREALDRLGRPAFEGTPADEQ